MEEQQILKGNTAIAIFDGYKFYPEDSLNGTKGVYRKKKKMSMFASDFKYHASWSWLMPVVQKINQFKPDIIDTEHPAFKVSYALLDCNITAVWLAVVSFIEYYNKINPLATIT